MLKKWTVLTMLAAAAVSSRASLVAHYTFDSDGTDSAGSNNTTLQNGAAVNTGTYMLGGGSLGGASGGMDGVDDQAITGSNLSITGSADRTLSVWFKAPADPGAPDDAPTMVGTGNSSGTGTRFDLRLSNSTGAITSDYQGYLRIEAQNGARTTTDNKGVNNDVWHHLMVTYSGTTLNNATMYLDGVQVTTLSSNTTSINTSAAPLVVGGSNHTTDTERSFYGYLDDVGVWSNSSTAADAAILNGLGRIGDNNLSNLAAAQTLWGGSLGDIASINGVGWQKVTGLTGALGDWQQVGGANGTGSYIVLDGSGNGIQIIPEPATVGLLGLFGAAAVLRRRMKFRK